jgi:4'-phosphopantetheinyl transferase EntD
MPRIATPPLPRYAAFAVRYGDDPEPSIVAAELDLIHRRAVATRRQEFVLGRAAAHDALGAIGLDDGPILSGPHREPIWPRGVVGSISHSAGIAVALVAPSTRSEGIGIDIERLRHAPELEGQVPRPEEWTWLRGTTERDRATAVFALFSAKEAVFKAFFPRVGSIFGFEAASLHPSDTGYVGRLVAPIDPDYPPKRTFVVTSHWHDDVVLSSVILAGSEAR